METPSELIPQATHGSPDHPLRIGDIEIPCYVLEDGRRVLVQTSVNAAIGISGGGANRPNLHPDRLVRFVSQKALEPHVSSTNLTLITEPVRFKTPRGKMALGYEATILADLCEAVLKARDDGTLLPRHDHIVKRADIMMRGFARVGIIALVDEATGYQEYRARQALEEILQKFISEELRKWAKTFPDEFYKELFRLRGLTYSEVSTKRPAYLGGITNDVVYKRLAPGVLDELRRITPRLESGRRKHRYHQRLTEDVGDPRLREHLASIITLMRASPNWATFMRLLNRALPKYGDQLPLPMTDADEVDV